MASEQAASQASQATPVTSLSIWINAFIPGDLEGAEVVPGSGAHAGKTMLPTPGPINAWFLTDQRGFSADPDAHSRMHSRAEIDLTRRELVSQHHRCDDTIQIDPETGEEVCRETPDNSDMAFEALAQDPDTGVLSLKVHGSTKNACMKVANIKVSPNLDYTGEISIAMDDDRTKIDVTFDGWIETYPAFEMYAAVDGGTPVTVFQEGVQAGATPLNLAGPATRQIKYTARLSRGA